MIADLTSAGYIHGRTFYGTVESKEINLDLGSIDNGIFHGHVIINGTSVAGGTFNSSLLVKSRWITMSANSRIWNPSIMNGGLVIDSMYVSTTPIIP